MDQLEDNLQAVDVALSADQLARLNEVSQLPREYPQWMVARQGAGRLPESN
jgi:hypothetical protein